MATPSWCGGHRRRDVQAPEEPSSGAAVRGRGPRGVRAGSGERLSAREHRPGCEDGPMVDRAVAAVLTVSDGVSAGTRADESGDVAEALLREAGFEVGARSLVPDDLPRIQSNLRKLAETYALVLTTGRTGFR